MIPGIPCLKAKTVSTSRQDLPIYNKKTLSSKNAALEASHSSITQAFFQHAQSGVGRRICQGATLYGAYLVEVFFTGRLWRERNFEGQEN